MASLYTRKGSPFFWIEYRDSRGIRRQESTGCRTDSAREVRRAKKLEAQRTLEELNDTPSSGRRKSGWDWVTGFLKTKYITKERTLERYLSVWETLRIFLAEKQVDHPQQFTRTHCFDYLEWRKTPNLAIGKFKAGHNTALYGLRVMSLVMHEAVVRELVTGNPCIKLGVRQLPVRKKPLLTEDDCQLILREIPKVEDNILRDFLHSSFMIARYQGCRLVETRLDPFDDVEINEKPDGTKSGTIRFRAKRGDFTTLLHPELIPFFEQLRRDGKRWTWEAPARLSGTNRQIGSWASIRWQKFMKDIGLKQRGITFHCTRVLVVTEMARNNVPESKARAYVNHASSTVHQIYQRLQVGDLHDCVAVVGGKRPSSSS